MPRCFRHFTGLTSLTWVLKAHVLSALIVMDLQTTWSALGLCLIIVEQYTIILVLVFNVLDNSVTLNYMAALSVDS